MMAHQVVGRELDDTVLLERGDSLAAVAERVAVPGFDFNEDNRIPVARDDVNFSTPPAVAAGKNCPPTLLKFANREIFAQFSKGHALLSHGR